MNEKHCLPPVGCKPAWEPQAIPGLLRAVNNLIFRQMNIRCRANGIEDVTAMHGWIMGYLYHHRGEDVFQRDIERTFSITRSTVTNILQLMEKKGYIRREGVPQDARLKKLVLTPDGMETHEKMIRTMHEMDAGIAALLSEEENAELTRLLRKLKGGLEQSKATEGTE